MRRQGERRRGERLDQAREQLAPVGDDAEVVQVGVVQADLRDGHDQQRLEDARSRSAGCSAASSDPRRTTAATTTAPMIRTVSHAASVSDRAAGPDGTRKRIIAGRCRSLRARRSRSTGSGRRAGPGGSARFSTTPRMRERPMASADALDQLVRRRARAHDQHRAVDHRGQQVRVGQQHHRRRVEDDPVERLRAPRRAAAACART